jgi:16S rRNA (adenine1518-N6/adenine1519-N6)-dimethyltransferase
LRHTHTPRKRFGQHFLHEKHFIARIVEAIDPQPNDSIVEIGPGLGALTRPLLERVAHLHVVEIDRDIVARLRGEYRAEQLTIHEGDALEFDFAALGDNLRVAGNLPYNISTPLLFHLAQQTQCIRDATFMLQKEVVERMAARPGGKEYGRLSVMLQVKFAVQALFNVPPGAFRPPPKVDSAVVRLTPLGSRAPRIVDERAFGELVTAAFSQRRKMLRHALKRWFEPDVLAALEIDPLSRAERLSPEQFVRCANYLVEQTQRGPKGK